jgi:Tfp pilus assembly protein PilO
VTRRRQEVLLAAGGALLALVAGTLLLVRPKQQAVAEARAARNAAVADTQALDDQIRALEALKADEAALRARARHARAEFPATPDLPALVDALQDAASQAGVDLASVAPSTPKPSTERPELAEIETTVTVTGGYFQVEDFLAKVENLVKGTDPGRVPPRAVLIRSVDVSGSSAPAAGSTAVTAAAGSAPPDQLLASITLAVFQLARSPATGAPATGTASTATTQTTQAR